MTADRSESASRYFDFRLAIGSKRPSYTVLQLKP